MSENAKSGGWSHQLDVSKASAVSRESLSAADGVLWTALPTTCGYEFFVAVGKDNMLIHQRDKTSDLTPPIPTDDEKCTWAFISRAKALRVICCVVKVSDVKLSAGLQGLL